MIVTMRSAPRQGLSLLEVVISLAIFLFSLVAISRLIDQGVDQAVELDLRAQAAMIAQSKIAEVTAGAIGLTGQESQLEEDSAWTWKLDAEADTIPGLYRVKVTVWRDDRGRRIEVALSQFVLDPAKRGGTDASAIGTDDTSTTGSTTSSTTGGSP
jgi:general secretion pathway protein I